MSFQIPLTFLFSEGHKTRGFKNVLVVLFPITVNGDRSTKGGLSLLFTQ